MIHLVKQKPLLIFSFILFVIATGILAGYRADKGSNDFDTFYNAGRAVLTEEGIYYAATESGEKEEAGPFLYPPFAACFFALFSILPLGAAAFLWNFFIISLFMGCIGLSVSLFSKFEMTIPRSGFDRLVIILLLAIPFLDNVSMAQVNILILFLCLSALALWKRGKTFFAGGLLAVAIWIKLTPALFCFYFLAKRSWKALLGVLIGSLVCVLLLPSLLFGLEGNRIFQRQWVGRSLKPRLISVLGHFKKYEPHPDRKSPETYQNIQLATTLVSSNQSLESSLTRWLLKDRNGYAYSTAFPIYSAQRYDKLPVLLGGISLKALKIALLAIQIAFLLFLLWQWGKQRGESAFAFEVSLGFLSMSLLSPLARSHQYVSFLFPILTLVYLAQKGQLSNLLLWGMRLCCLFYILQALPYGKAAGAGTWANLTLWVAFAISLAKPPLPLGEGETKSG